MNVHVSVCASTCVHVCVHICTHGVCAEVREPLAEVISSSIV